MMNKQNNIKALRLKYCGRNHNLFKNYLSITVQIKT